MKRNPRKVKWTKAFRHAAGKEMVIDSTLEFEKRRHVPVRYDRELVGTTLKAMKRVAEIRAKRERVLFKKRIAHGRSIAKEPMLADDLLVNISSASKVRELVIQEDEEMEE